MGTRGRSSVLLQHDLGPSARESKKLRRARREKSLFHLEHFQKYCSHTEGWGGKAVFLGFGFVSAQSQGFLKPAPSPKPRQNPKILASCGYSISSNALTFYNANVNN